MVILVEIDREGIAESFNRKGCVFAWDVAWVVGRRVVCYSFLVDVDSLNEQKRHERLVRAFNLAALMHVVTVPVAFGV